MNTETITTSKTAAMVRKPAGTAAAQVEQRDPAASITALMGVLTSLVERVAVLDGTHSPLLDSSNRTLFAVEDQILVERAETLEEARLQALLARNLAEEAYECDDIERIKDSLGTLAIATSSLFDLLQRHCDRLPAPIAGYYNRAHAKPGQPS